MKTTRLTLAVAVALVASSLAACGGSTASPAASPAASTAASAGAGGGTATGKNITLMVGVKGDPFYVSMECGAKEAATAAGATLHVQGPDKFDATLQNPMLDAVAAQKPDALLVAPNDVKASVAAAQEHPGRGDEGRAGRHHRRRPDASASRGSPPTTTSVARRRPRR